MSQISAELIADAKSGDVRSLQILLVRCAPTIRTHLNHRIRGNEFAIEIAVDDLMQETFASAVKSIADLRSDEPAKFVTWIRKIADNVHLEEIRKLATKRRGADVRRRNRAAMPGGSTIDLIVELEDGKRSPSSGVALEEAVRRLKLAIHRLPEDQRRVIELCYERGMTRTEAADVLDKSDEAVRSLVLRAKKKLRDFLEDSSLWFD